MASLVISPRQSKGSQLGNCAQNETQRRQKKAADAMYIQMQLTIFQFSAFC